MSNKKTIIGSAAAIVASVALIGGGTFAAWSDFAVVEDQAVAAGELTITVPEGELPWNETDGLSPGERAEVAFEVGSITSTVPSTLHVTLDGYTEEEDGCTNTSSEEAVDARCDIDGEPGQFADFTVLELAATTDYGTCDVEAFKSDDEATRTALVGVSSALVSEDGWYIPETTIPAEEFPIADWDWADGVIAEAESPLSTLRSVVAETADGTYLDFDGLVLPEGESACVYAAVTMPVLAPDANAPISLAQNAAMGDTATFGFKFQLEQLVD